MIRSNRQQYAAVALMMAAIVAVSLVITSFTGVTKHSHSKLHIVATFFPVYVAALQVTDGVSSCEVINLTPAHTGCLHDYQLTPDNMITLTGADVLILNGAGAESFLDSALKLYPSLDVIDTSKGVSILRNSLSLGSSADASADSNGELYNEHIWTSPTRYIQQIENLRDGLIKVDPNHAADYRANAAAYIEKIKTVRQQLIDAAAALPTKACITFHDSLVYFADELGLTTIASISMGEESSVSASELANASKAAAKAGSVLLFYDSQYDTEYTSVGADVKYSRILVLDSAVTEKSNKAEDKNAWLDAMRYNLEQLKEAAK